MTLPDLKKNKAATTGFRPRQKLRISYYPHRSELKSIARQVWKKLWEDEVFGRAAQLAYFWFFSLFPFMIFLTAVVSLSPLPSRLNRWITSLEDILPAEAYGLLISMFHQVTARHHQGVLSLSILALLWSSSAGMESIITSLNKAFDMPQSRPWWKEKLLAILLTIGFSIFFLGALVLLNFGETISRQLAELLDLGPIFLTFWQFLKWPAIILFVLLGVELIYFFAPNARQRWELFTPGALFALVLWLLISYGFRFYVSKFSFYNVTYGTLGGVMILMLWLYLTGVAILVGGEINAVVKD